MVHNRQHLQYIETCIKTINDADFRDNHLGTQIYGMQHLINKTKWVYGIAPIDNASLLEKLVYTLQEDIDEILSKKRSLSEISFQNPYKGKGCDFFIFALILTLLNITYRALTDGDIAEDTEKIFWYYFASVMQNLDMHYLPVDTIFGSGCKIFPNVWDLRAEIQKTLDQRRKGGKVTAALKQPLKEWVLQQAREIRKNNSIISKRGIAEKIYRDIYEPSNWKSPIVNKDTFYRWILNDKKLK